MKIGQNLGRNCNVPSCHTCRPQCEATFYHPMSQSRRSTTANCTPGQGNSHNRKKGGGSGCPAARLFCAFFLGIEPSLIPWLPLMDKKAVLIRGKRGKPCPPQTAPTENSSQQNGQQWGGCTKSPLGLPPSYPPTRHPPPHCPPQGHPPCSGCRNALGGGVSRTLVQRELMAGPAATP